MATRQELKDALMKAHEKGDRQSAELFASYLREGKYSDKISTTGAALQGFGQGATLGFADEAAAGLRSLIEQSGVESGIYGLGQLFGGDIRGVYDEETGERRQADFFDRLGRFGDYQQEFEDIRGGPRSYDELLAEQRGEVARSFAERPGAAITGSVVGGLGSGGAGAARAAGQQTLRQALPRLMGTGAAYGGVTGAGTSEQGIVEAGQQALEGDLSGLGELGVDVGSGAALGAAFAPVVPAIGAGLRGAARPFTRGMRAREQARQQVVTDLDDDLAAAGMTRLEAEELLQNNPNLTVADLGENLRNLAANAINTPGRGGAAFKEFLEDRVKGQSGRIMPALRNALGAGDETFADASEQLITRTKQAAGALYDEAYAVPTRVTTAMRAAANSPSGKAAMRNAQTLAAEEGRQFRGTLGTMASTRHVDAMIRGWDDHISKLYRAGKGNVAEKAKANREAFKREVYGQNDSYRQARAMWAGGKADEEAMDLGTKVFREFADVTEQQIRDFSESQLNHFRIGVLRAVQGKLRFKDDLADVTRELSKKEGVRDIMRVAFGSQEKFNRFMKILADEERMHSTFSQATRGSDTMRKLTKEAEVSKGRIGSLIGLLFGAKAGIPPFLAGAIGSQAGKQLGRRQQSYQRQVNEQLGDLLQQPSLQPLAPPTGIPGGLLSTTPPLPSTAPMGGVMGGLLGGDI